ncbi:hypothetical protein FDI69_gp163 [Rhodococcus phage Trina]|uniref:Uncharacterized protein n=1 Tax=Rhodococcus phage Trina TaxID=2027905 RepID=A0A2D0ZWV5_9CAUD|nr:hypothetical protein FDI69_gp163 [Rhodococcus phage Trina]ASZ75023.1 hypothetical protein SEA_TRINA_244 [Rhodococcus phage Trina]
MARFKVIQIYGPNHNPRAKEIDAEDFAAKDDWIIFYNGSGRAVAAASAHNTLTVEKEW